MTLSWHATTKWNVQVLSLATMVGSSSNTLEPRTQAVLPGTIGLGTHPNAKG